MNKRNPLMHRRLYLNALQLQADDASCPLSALTAGHSKHHWTCSSYLTVECFISTLDSLSTSKTTVGLKQDEEFMNWLLAGVLTVREDQEFVAEPGPAGGITTPSWPGSKQLSPRRRWRKLLWGTGHLAGKTA